MYSRSNIGASLNRKRQASLLKKILVCFVFILFFISLAVLGLTTDNVRIKNIIVSGNSSISIENIMNIANDGIHRYYLWIIPTDNIFLLRRSEIKNDILDNIKKIGSVSIYIDGFDKINISVVEREVDSLWCTGDVINQKDCYFMDSDGFIFEEAPQFSLGIFPEYFGLIAEENPIGQFYLKDIFSALGGKNIPGLYNELKNMSFQPQYFEALTLHEYEIYILGGGKIIMNDVKSFESSLINLQALVSNGYIKNDTESLKKIKHIDLRFGNKVSFELNK